MKLFHDLMESEDEASAIEYGLITARVAMTAVGSGQLAQHHVRQHLDKRSKSTSW